jgi:hypothetical protein
MQLQVTIKQWNAAEPLEEQQNIHDYRIKKMDTGA